MTGGSSAIIEEFFPRLGFWVISRDSCIRAVLDAPALAPLRNYSYSRRPFLIPGIDISKLVHEVIFLIVMPDLMLSSSRRSSSVRELRMLPSMANYSG